MGIQKPFPLTAEQLYLLTLPEQRNYPVVWKKKEHINGLDTSAQSKKIRPPIYTQKPRERHTEHHCT